MNKKEILDNLSNSELKIQMLNLENKYENVQNELKKNIQKLHELDLLYNKYKDVLKKRNIMD